MLPIYLPLDTKPKGDWTVSYLAKSIASDAGCTIDFLGDGIVWEENTTTFNFTCTMPETSVDFEIYVFLNKKQRDALLEKEDKSPSSHCFKKGSYYVVCETVTVINDTYINPGFEGEKDYTKFPGEPI